MLLSALRTCHGSFQKPKNTPHVKIFVPIHSKKITDVKWLMSQYFSQPFAFCLPSKIFCCTYYFEKIMAFDMRMAFYLILQVVTRITLYLFPLSVDYNITKKSFNFAKKHNMPFYFVSASDGTNVVKVGCFFKALKTCAAYMKCSWSCRITLIRQYKNIRCWISSRKIFSNTVQTWIGTQEATMS